MRLADQSVISNKYLRSIELGNYVGFLGTALLAFFISNSPTERLFLIGLTLSAFLFNFIVYRRLLAHDITRHRYYYLATVGMLLIIAGFAYILEPYSIHLEILYIAVIASIGILAGNRVAFISTVFITAFHLTILFLLSLPNINRLVNVGIHGVFILLAGYWTSNLTGLIHERLLFSSRQNRYLALLLKVGTLASQGEALDKILPLIAEAIINDLPITFCRIFILNPESQMLTAYDASPLNQIENWNPKAGANLPLQEVPLVQQLLINNQYQILGEGSSLSSDGNRLKTAISFSEVKTLALFPLNTKGGSLGLIAVGENRAWEREPFTQEKIDLLQTLATQIAAAIENARLFQAAQNQAQRLSVLNEVGKAIGSTIELDALLDLIYTQLSKVIPTDTYYVALLEPSEKMLDFRILIDKGERFPPTRIPISQGFSSWVIENRRPLLIRSVSQERDTLPITPIRLGQQEPSESWLGVPVQTGDRDLGVLAVASYAPYAFDEEDMALLSSVASQAALALDNARQHANVKEQARRDSLSGALNHGYFLVLLDESIQQARQQNLPISLIMLDIDFFKDYNDHYGHLVGDEVLSLLVQVIQPILNPSDFIGRWGGEEFAIGLPGATLDQAIHVAQNIRSVLAEIELFDQHGRAIPGPTVSQGIATFPQHAQDPGSLIDVADAALYRAKNAGRDQLIPAD